MQPRRVVPLEYETPPPKPPRLPLPMGVNVIAGIFIAFGGVCAALMVLDFITGRGHLNIGAACLVVGGLNAARCSAMNS